MSRVKIVALQQIPCRPGGTAHYDRIFHPTEFPLSLADYTYNGRHLPTHDSKGQPIHSLTLAITESVSLAEMDPAQCGALLGGKFAFIRVDESGNPLDLDEQPKDYAECMALYNEARKSADRPGYKLREVRNVPIPTDMAGNIKDTLMQIAGTKDEPAAAKASISDEDQRMLDFAAAMKECTNDEQRKEVMNEYDMRG